MIIEHRSILSLYLLKTVLGTANFEAPRPDDAVVSCAVEFRTGWYPIDIIIFDMYAVRIASSAIFSTFLGTKYYDPRIDP